MMYERFTDRARKAMQLANVEATSRGHDRLTPVHVLVGVCLSRGVAATVMKRLGVEPEAVATAARAVMPMDGNDFASGRRPHADATKTVIERSIEEAKALSDNYVGTEHMLLALTRDATAGPVLAGVGVTHETAAKALAELRAMLDKDKADRTVPPLTDAAKLVGWQTTVAYPETAQPSHQPISDFLRNKLPRFTVADVEPLVEGVRQLLAENDSLRKRQELFRRAVLADGYFKGCEVDDDLAPRVVERVMAATAAERERCAKVAEACEWGFQPVTPCGLITKIAAAIRMGE